MSPVLISCPEAPVWTLTAPLYRQDATKAEIIEIQFASRGRYDGLQIIPKIQLVLPLYDTQEGMQ